MAEWGLGLSESLLGMSQACVQAKLLSYLLYSTRNNTGTRCTTRWVRSLAMWARLVVGAVGHPVPAAQGYLLVQPVLHGSGFGNQVGMLIQHVALAASSGRALVLPSIRLPVEHRAGQAVIDLSVPAHEAFNLSAFAPVAHVLALPQLASAGTLDIDQEEAGGSSRMLTFSVAFPGGRAHRPARPLWMPPVPLPPTLAAVALLRRRSGCEEGHRNADGGSTVQCKYVRYCHLPSCRIRTRRTCRRTLGGCTRSAQRLPNNYLFAHRLAKLVCGQQQRGSLHPSALTHRTGAAGGIPSGSGSGSGSGGDGSYSGGSGVGEQAMVIEDTRFENELAALEDRQRDALRHLSIGDSLRSRAAAYAHQLGPYAAVHCRLRDVDAHSEKWRDVSEGDVGNATAAASKGIAATELPGLIAAFARRLIVMPPRHADAIATTTPVGARSRQLSRPASAVTIYLASNRADVVRRWLPAVRHAVDAAIRDVTAAPVVRVWGWHDLSLQTAQRWPGTASTPPSSAPFVALSGLRAALVEHELCVRAPLSFAGSPFSTFANLIGARRWLAGAEAPRAYVDLHSGAIVPACAAGAAQRPSM